MHHPHKTLSSLSIQAKKRLGQYFIISDNAIFFLKKHLPQESTFLEIGPGLGIITNLLLFEKKKLFALKKILSFKHTGMIINLRTCI